MAAFQRAGGCFAGAACDKLTSPSLKLNIAEVLHGEVQRCGVYRLVGRRNPGSNQSGGRRHWL